MPNFIDHTFYIVTYKPVLHSIKILINTDKLLNDINPSTYIIFMQSNIYPINAILYDMFIINKNVKYSKTFYYIHYIDSMQQLALALRVIRYHLYSPKHNYKIVFLTLTEKSFNIAINTKIIL